MQWDHIRAGLLVAVVLTAATFAGTTTAASEPSLTPDDATPGATTTHTVTVVVGEDAGGSSWNSFWIEYNQTDISEVGQGDIQTIGIDDDNDADGLTVDERVANDLSSVSGTDNGHTLQIGLDGSSNIDAGDELVVVFNDAHNPSNAGNYDVTMHINQGSADETATTTLSIGSTTTATTTTTSSTSTTDTTPSTTESTDQTTTTATPTRTTQAPTTTQTTIDGGNGDAGDSTAGVSLTHASITVIPDEANATATHAVSATIQSSGSDSWNSIKINYSGTGTDVSNVDQNDVAKIGIDRDATNPNTTVDKNVASDLGEVSGSNSGTTLTIGLDGSSTLHAGDEVVVVYEDVQNPPAGQYSIPVDVNHQSSGDTANASLALHQSTTTETSTTTASSTGTDAASSPTTTQSATASLPGFTTSTAIVALAAAALLVRG